MKSKGRLHIPEISIPLWWPSLPINWRVWLPSRGNVLFTMLVLSGLLWAGSAGAFPLGAPAAASTSTGTVAYQGRLADASGNPVTATVPMIFRLYSAASGGTGLWEEQWTGPNSVRVSDGLFNVMLGSLTAIPQNVVTGNANLWLGITVNTDNEMQPRVQLGSVPFAVQALTVPDASISTAKLADGSVTAAKLAPGSVNVGIPISSASMPTEIWSLPACDSVARSVPGLQLSIPVNGPSTLDISFSGLARNSKPTSATLTTIAVDGVEIKAASGQEVFGGFRNGSSAALLYGDAAIHVTSDVTAGTRTVDVRARCDAGATDAAIGYAWLSVRVFPK